MTISADFRALCGRDLASLVESGQARKIADGLQWGEGPAWVAHQERWVFSDIPNNRMLAWSEDSGLHVFREPSNFANGNSLARDGALLTCEHGTRRVTRTAVDGNYSVLCDRFGAGRLNSPNDIVEGPDGRIWFSDPTYGIISDIEGYRAPSEQEANRVYSFDPATGELKAQIDQLSMPNGLCFAPHGRTLYVSDSGAEMGPEIGFDPAGSRHVFAFDVNSDGTVTSAGKLFATAEKGVPDGIRCDDEGYLWVSTEVGAECFATDGARAGVIATPEILSNLAFGGPDGNDMLMMLANSAYIVNPTGNASQ